MSKKNTILLIVFLVLVTMGFIYDGPWQERVKGKQQEVSFLAELDIELINKIEIDQSEKDLVVLYKEDFRGEDKWRIDDYKDFYISRDESEKLTNGIKRLIEDNLLLISRDKEKKEKFWTNEDGKGMIVKFINDNDEVLNEMIVGRNTGGYNFTYVSQADTNKTYQAEGNVYGLFSKTDWRDRTIFNNIDRKENINSLRIQRRLDVLNVVKKDNQWMYNEEELDNEKVDLVLSKMTKLTSKNLPEQSFDNTGLEKNNLIVQVMGDGIDNTIMIGGFNILDGGDEMDGIPEERREYYVKKGDSDNIYLIEWEDQKVLDANIEDLK